MDFKFLNAEELLQLRAKGRVAVSNQACHLIAFVASCIFLINGAVQLPWKDLFITQNLHEMQSVLDQIFILVITSLLLYLSLILFLAALQSRFYFSVAKVFSRSRPIFQFSIFSRIFSIGTLMKSISLLLIFTLAILAWFQIAPDSLLQMLSAEINFSLENLTNLASKLLTNAAICLVIVAFLLIFIAKIAFRFDNKL